MKGDGTLLYIGKDTHKILKEMSEVTDVPMTALVKRAVKKLKKEIEKEEKA